MVASYTTGFGSTRRVSSRHFGSSPSNQKGDLDTQPAGSLSALTEALVEKHKLGFAIAYSADARAVFAATGAYGAALEQSQRQAGRSTRREAAAIMQSWFGSVIHRDDKVLMQTQPAVAGSSRASILKIPQTHIPVGSRVLTIPCSCSTFMASGLLVHNHPSGDPTPSRADIQMTQAIVEIARPLGIAVHDHIIVGKEGNANLKG